MSWFRSFFRLPYLPELVARAGDYWLLAYYLKSTSRPGTFDPETLAIYKSSWARERAIGKMINTYRAPPIPVRGITQDGHPPIPVRVIWGDRDAFVPLASSRLSEAYLGEGEIRHWPKESHWLLLEEPIRTAREMIDFFTEYGAQVPIPL